MVESKPLEKTFVVEDDEVENGGGNELFIVYARRECRSVCFVGFSCSTFFRLEISQAAQSGALGLLAACNSSHPPVSCR